MSNGDIKHLGRDEPLQWQLLAEGEPVEAIKDTVTRIQVVLDDNTTFDSAANPELFDWTLGDGRVEIMLTHQAITPGHYQAKLIVYDADHLNGFTWGRPQSVHFL